MANETNKHPITGAGSGILTALKSNPFGAFLISMVALAFIVRPRRRKSKSKKKRSWRRKRKNPGNPCRTKNPGNPGSRVKKSKKSRKARRQPKAPISRARRPSTGPRRSTGTGKMPERFRGKVEKGSQIAKEKGEWLRSQRKK